MLINYSPDGDLLNLISIEIEADSATGEFSFDRELPIPAVDATLYVGNDIFGLRLERSKQATIDLKANGDGGLFTAEMTPLWGKGDSVEVIAFEREGDANTYVKGKFVITSIEETSPAQDDATYSVSLENDGEPDVYPGKTTTV